MLPSRTSKHYAQPIQGKILLQRPYTYRGRSNQAGPEGESIRFSVFGQPGFMLKDAREKNYRGLDGRDDAMFINAGSCVSIRLEVRRAFSNSPLSLILLPVLQPINCRSWSRQV
jgi:hypothetical protein